MQQFESIKALASVGMCRSVKFVETLGFLGFLWPGRKNHRPFRQARHTSRQPQDRLYLYLCYTKHTKGADGVPVTVSGSVAVMPV